jgi:hypothetical protein
MKHLLKRTVMSGALLVVLVLVGSARLASGAVVYCQIGMMGKATLDAPLSTATAFTLFENARVGCGTDAFAVPGAIGLNTPVTFSPFSFDPLPPTPISMWSFTSNDVEYELKLDSLNFERFLFGGNEFLNFSGQGFLFVNGVRHAPADFCFSTQQCVDSTGTTVTWSAQTTVPHVPEGGSAVIFIFIGIIGIEVFRRRCHRSSQAKVVSSVGFSHPEPS